MFVKTGQHLVGALVACSAFVVQGVIIYAGLLACAVVADADTGGPLAGPFLLLLSGVVGVVLVPLLFLPASVIGEVAAKRGRLFTKGLVATAVAGALAMVYVFLAAVATGVGIAHSLLASLIGVLTVLVPTVLCVSVSHGVLKLMPSTQRNAHG
ncbi:hypothetical protein E1293_43095 [Actinomadura darangshiensis]|uniref:Uncharacterized protein n=1 Tax=Actinomadura darangshiensis TaxID=705336 RepID=A0A4R4ZYT2_9ACTN|nr:hypothetical protein [Actinomadura darangshiensis]TDD63534.1 hypothetical protein E1293_43095 [Actinomadura darangshiensis]